MNNNQNKSLFKNNTNGYMQNYNDSLCLVAPNPNLSQKELYKLAKQNSYRIEGEIITPDFDDFEKFQSSYDVEKMSCDFVRIKSKRSLKVFSF